MKKNTAWFWLSLVAGICGLAFWFRFPGDPDLGWHLFGGAYIYNHHAVPREDLINSFNLSWHDYHWLSQLGMYALYRLGGYEALRIALGVLMCLEFVLLVQIAKFILRGRRPGLDLTITIAVAIFLIARLVQVRPQMLSLFIVTLVVHRLIQRPTRWELPYIFLLTVLLVNIHVYWAMIPVLWGIYRCMPRIFERRGAVSKSYAWGGLVLISLSGFISPYGIFGPWDGFSPFLNYFVLLEYLDIPAILSERVGEFQGTFTFGGFYVAVMFVVFAYMVRIFKWRRALADLPNTLAAWLGMILSILAIKYVALLAAFTLPYCLKHRRALSLALPKSWKPYLPQAEFANRALLAGAGIWCLGWAALTFPFWYQDYDVMPKIIPFNACIKAAQLDVTPPPGRSHVRVLTYFDYGGWCRWIMYQTDPKKDIRVTSDNRTQWVPAQHYEMMFDLFLAHWNWFYTLRGWDPDLVVAPTPRSLAAVLRLMPKDWKLEYADEYFSLFKHEREIESK